MIFSRKTAKRWMIQNKHNHLDPRTGKLNYTSLVEDCCQYFNSPLDAEDETHWIWELLLEVKYNHIMIDTNFSI
jgi:hypothetical protein